MSNEEVLGQEITKVVKELNNAILALRTLIEKEYPNRREIEAEFVKKDASDRRLILVLATILVSTLLSFGITMTTVSTCFLGEVRPSACNLLPGYERSNDERDELLEILLKGEKRSRENRARIEKLEGQR